MTASEMLPMLHDVVLYITDRDKLESDPIYQPLLTTGVMPWAECRNNEPQDDVVINGFAGRDWNFEVLENLYCFHWLPEKYQQRFNIIENMVVLTPEEVNEMIEGIRTNATDDMFQGRADYVLFRTQQLNDYLSMVKRHEGFMIVALLNDGYSPSITNMEMRPALCQQESTQLLLLSKSLPTMKT